MRETDPGAVMRAPVPDRPFVELAALTKHYTDNPSFLARALGISRTVSAVTDVSLRIPRGSTLGLVGESGCGKSTLARCMSALEPATSGDFLFDDRPVRGRRRRDLSWFRSRCQIVFQDPQSSLNRSMKVEEILARGLVARARKIRDREREIRHLLDMVGLGAGFAGRYPHELSGGQRQRVGIARALAAEPDFLILDEPVSALDVSIQAQVVNLLLDLQEQLGLTYLFISHDLNLVRYISDSIAVMYLGRIVETGPTADVYADPHHPYTQLLLASIPKLDPAARRARIDEGGEVPSPLAPPSGCAFHPRCPRSFAPCDVTLPLLREVSRKVAVACHLHEPRDRREPSAAATFDPGEPT